jgi:predicted KAP-like P-loop ATPase
MGYQHQALRDIRFVCRQLIHNGKRPRLVVFIDDLDRCSDDKIMEILQAINLILGESDFFVFLGVDTEMLYRAIQEHYTRNHTDRKLLEHFAANYLRKIIQLSFHI